MDGELIVENFIIELAEDIIFPNISVYRKFYNGILSSYEVYSKPGYVIYDLTDENYETDPETLIPRKVNYYYTWVSFPANFSFSNFTWLDAPRDSIDEKYIFD